MVFRYFYHVCPIKNDIKKLLMIEIGIIIDCCWILSLASDVILAAVVLVFLHVVVYVVDVIEEFQVFVVFVPPTITIAAVESLPYIAFAFVLYAVVAAATVESVLFCALTKLNNIQAIVKTIMLKCIV